MFFIIIIYWRFLLYLLSYNTEKTVSGLDLRVLQKIDKNGCQFQIPCPTFIEQQIQKFSQVEECTDSSTYEIFVDEECKDLIRIFGRIGGFYRVFIYKYRSQKNIFWPKRLTSNSDPDQNSVCLSYCCTTINL